MGYSTDFTGSFKLNKPLDPKTLEFLTKLAGTRRMKRNIEGYGYEGEFFVDGGGMSGQAHDDTVVDYNTPPLTQPGLWCQWIPNKDGTEIEWDGGEKFYNYVEWIQYIVTNILAPRGYVLDGEVQWQGEERSDMGFVIVINNEVKVQRANGCLITFEDVNVKPLLLKFPSSKEE